MGHGEIDCEVQFIGTNTYTTSEITDEIWIESLQIDQQSNRSPSCEIKLSATTNAKNIARGDVVEVIREGTVYSFYGMVEGISQQAGEESLNISCEGMLYYAGLVKIYHKHYTDTSGLFHNLIPISVNSLTYNNDNINSPLYAVEALHTTEKNFNVNKDVNASLVPTVIADAGTDPNNIAIPFNPGSGHPSTRINKIAMRWQRPVGTGGLGELEFDICPDNGSGAPDLANIIAHIDIDHAWLVAKGVTVGGGWKNFVVDRNDPGLIIDDTYNNMDLQRGQRYWMVLQVKTPDATPLEVEWDCGNSAQAGDKWNVRTKDIVAGTWHPWLQTTGAGNTFGSYTPADAQYEFFIGAIPWFEIEFRDDWIPLKRGKDYIIERGSCDVQFGGDKNVSRVDSLSFENQTRFNPAGAGSWGTLRASYSEGELSISDCFELLARDFLRDIVDKVDVNIASTWEMDDWLINGSDALRSLQALCGVDRISMRIFKDHDLVPPRVVFEVRDKMVAADYTDYSATEQEYRTFRAGEDCSDVRELGETARISRASKSYSQQKRVNRVTVSGAEEIIAARTNWGDTELVNRGVIRPTSVSSDIINTQAKAFGAADEILTDYASPPFEGDIEIIDSRYDSYKMFTDTNGLVKIVISELGINGWFEIDGITTRWDGGSNWVNTIRIGGDTSRYKIPNLEGLRRTGVDWGPMIGEEWRKEDNLIITPKGMRVMGKSRGPVGKLTPGGIKTITKFKPPGSNIDEDDEGAETYEANVIMVYRPVTKLSGAVYLDIGNSDADPANDAIQGSILNGDRILCKSSAYMGGLNYTTYYAIVDKEVAKMDEETDFPETIREVALCDAASGAANWHARAVFKQVATGVEGYARDVIANNEVVHHFIKFTSDQRLYVFFDLDKP